MTIELARASSSFLALLVANANYCRLHQAGENLIPICLDEDRQNVFPQSSYVEALGWHLVFGTGVWEGNLC